MTDDFPFEATIEYFSESIDFNLENTDVISSWLESVISKEGQEYQQLSFIFCSDDYLLEMNQKHLDHHDYTDVITFCLSEEPIEADIFISIDRVRENARSYSVPFEQELYRVMVHGVLHCLGYEDKSPEKKQEMRNRENLYLSLLD